MSLLPPAFVLLLLALTCNAGLFPLYWWHQIDFTYNTPADRQRDIDSGVFVEEHVIPVGLELWEHKVFVTLPRWKSGVPASLAYFNKQDATDSPQLMPFPDWEAHNLTEGNPKRIISPFRVEADSCDRLWVLDTGVVDILNITKFEVLDNTRILIYNLKDNNKLIRSFKLPDNQLDEMHSFFANLVVDVVTCDETYAYLADLAGYLVVYDFKNDVSWRVDHEFFKLDPNAINFQVAGFDFQFKDGIFGLALTKMDPETEDRTLFFHPFSSYKEFKVSAKVLRDERMSQDKSKYILLGERGPMSQANAAALDPITGVLLYTQVNHDAIGCWNTNDKRRYSRDNQDYLDQNHTTLVFPNDIKVDDKGNAWVLSDRMTDFTLKNEKNFQRVNFRILNGSVSELIKNTRCDLSSPVAPASKSNARQSAVELALIPVVYLVHKFM